MSSKYVTMKRSEIVNHQDWMSSWLAIFIVRYKRLDSQIDEETTKWTGSPESFESVESLANDNNGIIVSATCGSSEWHKGRGSVYTGDCNAFKLGIKRFVHHSPYHLFVCTSGV